MTDDGLGLMKGDGDADVRSCDVMVLDGVLVASDLDDRRSVLWSMIGCDLWCSRVYVRWEAIEMCVATVIVRDGHWL